MIHTTINLHPEFYEYLFTEYARFHKLSYTELACIIMKCVSEEMPQRKRPRRAVEYQRSPYEGKTDWVVVHLYLTEEDVKALFALVAGFDTCVLLTLRTIILWI